MASAAYSRPQECRRCIPTQSSKSLLRCAAQEHPPRGHPDYQLPKIDSSNIELLLRKAVVHYHPDKQSAHETRWQVLASEIAKVLSAAYTKVRGC